MPESVDTSRLVVDLIQEVLPWRSSRRDISDELSLADDLGIDSLGMVALAFRIAEELEIDLDLDDETIDLVSIETVGDVHAAVAAILQRERGA
jgi:acyl carrier protein